MYQLWSRPTPSTSITPAPDALVVVEPSLVGNVDAMRQERSRQLSVDLLRDRAFQVRESSAEQQNKTYQTQLMELRAEVSTERQAAERKLSALQADLNEANASLAAEREAGAAALKSEREANEARLAAAVAHATSEGEHALQRRERELQLQQQQQQEVRAREKREVDRQPCHQRHSKHQLPTIPAAPAPPLAPHSPHANPPPPRRLSDSSAAREA